MDIQFFLRNVFNVVKQFDKLQIEGGPKKHWISSGCWPKVHLSPQGVKEWGSSGVVGGVKKCANFLDPPGMILKILTGKCPF